MAQTAAQIQKERTRQLEQQADELLGKCDTVTLASVNEGGYPRICTVSKLCADSLHDIYFVSSKRSALNGKVTHFEKNEKASVCYSLGGDSVTLIGTVDFVCDRERIGQLCGDADKRFFSKGLDDPKFRLLKFRTMEATFWIDGKFRTCKYKLTEEK